jgi:hypothetical protein
LRKNTDQKRRERMGLREDLGMSTTGFVDQFKKLEIF